MKKLLLIFTLLLIPTFIFSTNLTRALEALKDSTALLEKANVRIEELEAENLDYKTELTIASVALKKSNETLKKAMNRIDEDQKEIIRLRKNVDNLINAGVEVETFYWNIMLFGGYPFNMGMGVAYNLHWYPPIGILVAFDFNFDTMTPVVMGGVKINLK